MTTQRGDHLQASEGLQSPSNKSISSVEIFTVLDRPLSSGQACGSERSHGTEA